MKNSISSFVMATIISSVLSVFSISTQACTNIPVKAQDGTIIVGRTVEFGPLVDSDIISSPRDRVFKSTTPDTKPGISWRSRYGYLLMDIFKNGDAIDGINEKGLSFGYLYLPGYTQYQSVPKGHELNAIPSTLLGDWILSNFANVAEVKQALKNKYVFATPFIIDGKKVVYPLHAIVNDKQGKSIVIEFVKGEMRIYDNSTGILTNSPPYPWQLNNLKNYIKLFSPYIPKPVTIGGVTYARTGEGSGLIGLPGDPTPPSRFVKATVMQVDAMPVRSATEALVLAQHLMNAVDIPYGISRGKSGSANVHANLDSTQWVVFKDLTHLIFYYRSYNNLTLQKIDMNKIDFSPRAKQLKIPIVEDSQIIPDATQKFLAS